MIMGRSFWFDPQINVGRLAQLHCLTSTERDRLSTFYKRAVILVATSGGATMLARIGMVRGLNRYHVREFSRKPHHWGKRKLRRGPMTVWILEQ